MLLTEKLIKIYNDTDKKIYKYDNNIKFEIKHNIEEFFTKVLLNEKIAYLLDIGIPQEIFNIIENAISLMDEAKQNAIQEKLTHYREWYEVSQGRLSPLPQKTQTHTLNHVR